MVTGASGFTGKVMVAHLLKANLYDKIHAVDIVRPTFESPTVINHQADIAGRPPSAPTVAAAPPAPHPADAAPPCGPRPWLAQRTATRWTPS